MPYVERERRYPSDLTDEQWAVIEAMLPLPKWMGRPERHPASGHCGRDPVRRAYRLFLAAAINQMIRRLTRGRPARRQQRWRWPDTLPRH